MAIYEFKCPDCEFIQEEEHPMAEAPSETKCMDCGKTIKRYYGSMNFVLKGDGWPSKSIRKGESAIADNKFEADQLKRKRNGQRTFDKEVPMSDEEFKRRKKLNERWLEESA